MSNTRCLDIINRSLRMLGVSATGETADAIEAKDSLFVLNSMLDAWSAERLTTYALNNQIFPITASKGTYTIGPGADWDTTRPTKIESCFVRDNTASYLFDYQVELIPNSKYQELFLKFFKITYPQYAMYNAQYPYGVLSFWPVPIRDMLAGISQWQILKAFGALTDYVNLPPGYELALAYGLAYEMAPEYGVDPAKFRVQLEEAKSVFKRVNTESTPLLTDSGYLTRSGHPFNILGGI